jgi:hypothetical protein
MTNTTKYLIGGAIAVAAVYFLFFYDGKKVKLKYNFVGNFNRQGQVPESGDDKMANFRIPNWANAAYDVTADKIGSLLKGRKVIIKNADGKKAGSGTVRKVFKGDQGGDVFVQLELKYDDVTPTAKVSEDELGTLVTA